MLDTMESEKKGRRSKTPQAQLTDRPRRDPGFEAGFAGSDKPFTAKEDEREEARFQRGEAEKILMFNWNLIFC